MRMEHGLQGRVRQLYHRPGAICINRTLIKKRLLVEFSCEFPLDILLRDLPLVQLPVFVISSCHNILIIAIRNIIINATMQGRWKRKLSSLTLESKVKLSLLVIPQPFKTRQTYFQQSHLPNYFCPNYYLLLPRNNTILHKQISLPSCPAIAS